MRVLLSSQDDQPRVQNVEQEPESESPILFEECYCLAENQSFIDKVKSSSKVIPGSELGKKKTEESK
jgi:hypothetical protein